MHARMSACTIIVGTCMAECTKRTRCIFAFVGTRRACTDALLVKGRCSEQSINTLCRVHMCPHGLAETWKFRNTETDGHTTCMHVHTCTCTHICTHARFHRIQILHTSCTLPRQVAISRTHVLHLTSQPPTCTMGWLSAVHKVPTAVQFDVCFMFGRH